LGRYKNKAVIGEADIKHEGRKVFILCWLAYACAYLCRVNMSIAIPSISQSLGYSKTSLGLVGSSFFWAYGIGQLINGYIGDRISGRIFIFFGLLVSALINIFFGLAPTLVVMVILWMFNGYFQSMLWGPIVRILSRWFHREENTRVSVGISTSMVGGFLISWGLLGQVLSNARWSWIFLVPGIIVAIYGFIWILLIRPEPFQHDYAELSPEISNTGTHEDSRDDAGGKRGTSFIGFIMENRLWIIAISCVTQGIVKEGITLWGPSYLMETQGLDLGSNTTYVLLIPLMNFGGIFLSGWLNKKFRYNHDLAIMTLLSGSALAILGLFLLGRYSVLLGVILLGSCSACMYGANTLLMSVIPMGYAKINKTSAVAGFLNFSNYMGAGMSGVVTGAMSDYWGWNGILAIWIFSTLLGASVLWIRRISKGPNIG
jgi:OPA family glycerol-3-phosphate transporter-like MFS transporter